MGDDVIDVIVEIPAGSRNKYEYDHERHQIRLDRRLFSATVYPADYGFVPDTLAADGDPLDALVLLQDPTFPGCLIRARVLGVFRMEDEAGSDAKIVTVLHYDPTWDHVTDIEGVPAPLRAEIEHFFSVYKDLEPRRSSRTLGFGPRAEALEIVDAARRRHREQER